MAKNKGIYRNPVGEGYLYILDADKRHSKNRFMKTISQTLSVTEETNLCYWSNTVPKLFKLPYEFINFHGE